MKVEEIKSTYTDQKFIDQFVNLFGLKLFLDDCIISKDYDFANLDSHSIVLSSKGLELFELLKKDKFSTTENELLKIAIFLEFYNSDLLIDVDKTNFSNLSASISKEVTKGNILFPWIYGRSLYDKYFDEFEEQESSLENEKVIKLLKNTPTGVFQLGKQIIGPLGILTSTTNRILPPTRRVRLWHCSDPSCTSFHLAQLNTARTKLTEISLGIYELTRDIENSEWYSFYIKQCQDPNSYYDDNRIDDIPITLVYSFGESELRLVLKEILDVKKGTRDILPIGKKFNGSSESIIKSLTKAECFQVILLFSSKDILEYTEKLIFEKRIHIPSTEIRVSNIQKSGGFFKIHHECNKLGFRSISSDTHLSFIRLRNLILKIYEEPYLRQQLEWQLRFFDKESLTEKVEEYINNQEPRKIIRDVILNGILQVNKTFEILHGYFVMPTTPDEEEKIIDKILWKLGFSINIYPSFLAIFEERLSKFKKIISESSTYSEFDKEKIRSAAVNLFVSLEEVMKHALAFSTWLLLSDHYRVTRFKYNYSDATIFMTQTLNGYKLGDDTELKFDTSGRNTLFPLIEGFSALIGICDTHLNGGKENLKRSESELPNFIGKTNLVSFPLNYKILLFDIKTSSYLKVREIAIKLTTEFNRHKVLGTRNALEHDRDDFPLKSELLNACSCMKDSVEDLKISGLFPNVYLFKSLTKDKYNRVLKTFEDYNGKEIIISELINYKGYPIPSSNGPIVIVPSISFPETTDPIRIKYEENSEYLFYWKNFPRKKEKQLKIGKGELDNKEI